MMIQQTMILHSLLMLFGYISIISSRIVINNISSSKVHLKDNKMPSEYHYYWNNKDNPMSYYEPKRNIGNKKLNCIYLF